MRDLPGYILLTATTVDGATLVVLAGDIVVEGLILRRRAGPIALACLAVAAVSTTIAAITFVISMWL